MATTSTNKEVRGDLRMTMWGGHFSAAVARVTSRTLHFTPISNRSIAVMHQKGQTVLSSILEEVEEGQGKRSQKILALT